MTSDWFAGLESAFTTFGGVPEEVLMDNPRALVVRHDAVSRSIQFNDKLIAFAKHWGFRPRACAPYRARTKGKTESGVGYVKKNAIAGHSFASWEAFPAVKELAGFDFEAQPSIDPKQIRDLAASRWIANGENVLLLGPPEPAS
jgi:transposase